MPTFWGAVAGRVGIRRDDATGIKLTGLGQWAQFSATVCGAKLHVLYDPDADRPLYFEVTTAKVNDITPAKAMPIEAGATYVFDLVRPHRSSPRPHGPQLQEPRCRSGPGDTRRVDTETGKELRILTNDLAAPADEIAGIYKGRWQVELFFRWIKQTLKVRHFLGMSENAVRIQIAVALIAFLAVGQNQRGMCGHPLSVG